MSDATHNVNGPTAEPVDLRSASTGELVQLLSAQVSELVRGELALARAELKDTGTRLGVGAGLAGAAGVVALGGALCLLAAVIAALALVLPVWAAALIVGVVLLVVAAVLGLLGRRQLQHATPPVPEQAARGVQEDVRTVREGLHRS
jgi:tetrahydromethanopterin S-methyltransferase subunit C